MSAPIGTVLGVVFQSIAVRIVASNFLSQRTSLVASEHAIYSASSVERATTDCVHTCQWIGPDLIGIELVNSDPKNMQPPTDFRVAVRPAQSLSVNPVSGLVFARR